ncbi:hypothetical protein ACIOZL_40790 [Streptomyces sp. NPDC087769]|uniref:hypothetical protein n=1 Tax=Streptomyces sp. NPDC087769 TaxID=3365802 RepID=UPI00381CD9A2
MPAALVDHLRTGSDTERAGAVRAWYWTGLPLRADRSPAYAPSGSRDPAPDESRDVVDSRLEESMRVFASRHIRRWAAVAEPHGA